MEDSHVVVVKKMRDDYGSVVALKVMLFRRRDHDGEAWETRRSHVFSAAFSRRSCREQAERLAARWADEYDARIKRGD